MRRLPSLTALRTFECAARHAHFGRADFGERHLQITLHLYEQPVLGARRGDRPGDQLRHRATVLTANSRLAAI
ncbi:hypothetical protein JQX08_02170 [Pseudomonas sp. UL073]|uniref:Uncharacterized protein n=1 Tax=Zestomonas insulae TaxID=2809017 RepID=A0ABS2IA18_9GAMM|nr:hypothetical protein [Pseudomonas insulae]MBM7059503.1 hypothetical protein [Pseudomonas insulae]